MLNPEELKYELYDHYIDQDGQVTIDKDPGKWSTGNGLMHTGHAMVLFKKLNILTSNDKIKFKEVVQACEKSPGEYYRNPNRPDDNRQDDLIGISAGSVATDNNFNNDIEDFAWKNLFIWNLDNDLTWGDFLGRHIFHMMFLLLNTGKKGYLPFLPLLLMKMLLIKPTSYSIIHTYLQIESLNFLYQWLSPLRNFIVKRLNLDNETIRYYKSENHPIVGLSKYVQKT